jgi:hypothetical protein
MGRNKFPKTLGVAAGMLLAVVVFASDPLIEYTGEGTDHLGASVAFGDVNGDGLPDVVIGADAGGYVRVYNGRGLLQELHPDKFVSDRPGDNFGIALAVGDMNCDGKAEVVVGASYWSAPGAANVGYVQGFDGVTGALRFEIRGQRNTDFFGSALALGDVTGDGCLDLLVGAPFADVRGTNDNNGYVALYNGKALYDGTPQAQAQLFRWLGVEHYDEMGRAVAFGDVNKDGRLDIILGAGSGNLTDYGGYVQVMNGRNFGQQLYKFTDGQSHLKPEMNFGFRVTAADVNGDGHADVIVGAYRGRNSTARRAPATGYVRVYSGFDGTQLYQVNGDNNGDEFGRAVAAADVDGDGFADVVVGARFGVNGGYVRIFYGPDGAQVDEEVAAGAFDWFGHSVAASAASVGAGAYQGDSRAASQGGYVRIYAY